MADFTNPNELWNVIRAMKADIEELKLRNVQFGDASEAIDDLSGLDYSHERLSDLQGGATDDRYHLEGLQHNDLIGGTYTDLHAHYDPDDVVIEIDGALAVATNVSNAYLVTLSMTIAYWYIYVKSKGSASATIIDVNCNGTTVFGDQANRPQVAYNAANNWAVSGSPSVLNFIEGDVLTFDIDQIGTGAADLVIVGKMQVSPSGAAGLRNYVLIEDYKTAGTNGGTATAGLSTRDLTRVTMDDGNNVVQLASNQFTLKAGVYEVRISAPAYRTKEHQVQLYNVKSGAIVKYGSSEYDQSGSASAVTRSVLHHKMSLAEETTFEVRHNVETTKTTNGFGITNSFGAENIYTVVELVRVL